MKTKPGIYRVLTSHGHVKELRHDGEKWHGWTHQTHPEEIILGSYLLELHNIPEPQAQAGGGSFDSSPAPSTDSFSGGGSDSGFGGGGASDTF